MARSAGTCRGSGFFDDVRLSVSVKRPGERKSVPNECDVMVKLNGRLALVSCKTGKLQNPRRHGTEGGEANEDDEKHASRQAIYELDSLLQAEVVGLPNGYLYETRPPDPADLAAAPDAGREPPLSHPFVLRPPLSRQTISSPASRSALRWCWWGAASTISATSSRRCTRSAGAAWSP